jgi:endo-1,4-beta-mannosidase
MSKKPNFVSVIFLMTILVIAALFFTKALNPVKTCHLPWVTVAKTSFIKDGNFFKFVGASAVNLVFYDNWDLDVERALSGAKENNISVLRIYLDWGWGKEEDYDRILDLAAKYGIYVILTLTDCCCSGDYKNEKEYFQVHAPFCDITNIAARTAFKKRIKQIIERRNSVNGRIYRQDSTILAWEIANELEYWRFSFRETHDWLEDVAKYIKSLDTQHLVTVGLSLKSFEKEKIVVFSKIFDNSGIDFISYHFYPEDLALGKDEKKSISVHSSRVKIVTENLLAAGKPVILGEFGFSNSARVNLEAKAVPGSAIFYNEFMKGIMDAAFSSGASGVMFWGWGVPGEHDIPMWWNQESHSVSDKVFCDFIRRYRIPPEG